MNKKSKKKNISPFHKYLIISLIIVSCLLLGLIHFVGVLPTNYFTFITSLLVFFDGILILNLLKSKSKYKSFSSLCSILLIILLMICIIYVVNTISFLKKLGVDITVQEYSLIVRNDTDITKIDQLTKKTIGVLNTQKDNYPKAIKELERIIVYTQKSYTDITTLKDQLLTNKVDAILLESTKLNLIKENDPEFANQITIIYTLKVETITKDITKKVDVTEDSFNIYLSGIDTYGPIGTLSRSDVNIILTINPSTAQIHITSIPRDYYVTLPSKNALDKLTHAGIYGVEESVLALEELLSIDINYFVKVNFTSIIDIVDTIGPIEVYSDYDFQTGIYDSQSETYHFQKGLNTLNGKQALAFSRERKSFANGDRTRNANQEKVLKAIIEKALSKTIITKYNSLLSTLSDSFITNLDDSEITNFIKMQIKNNYSWQITSYILNGTDAYDYTYTLKEYQLYVMYPTQSSIKEAQEKIKSIS